MDCVLTDRIQRKPFKRKPKSSANKNVTVKHHVLDMLLTQIHIATLPITQNSIFRIFRNFKGTLATKKLQVFCNRIVIICQA